MKITGKSVVVTGGASGIGRALAERFAAQGARGVTVADINAEWARKIAARIGGVGVGCDVANPDSIAALVTMAEQAFGPIDVFCCARPPTTMPGWSGPGGACAQCANRPPAPEPESRPG